jgi:serine/threonine-protein kinase HipA
MADREVEVLVQVGGEDLPAGRLWGHRRRGVESQTFGYSREYLARAGAYELDPALPLVEGPQQTPAGRPIFGAFSDSSPDRWGRKLIKRGERRRAGREQRAERSFGETELLLGVRDDLRQGALRFRDPQGGEFLADEEGGVPAMLALPRLLRAAERADLDEDDDDDLATLLRGGSSLGGARPKAHVVDPAGRVSIAKFPRPSDDEWDVMRWEAVALRLAREAGIDVASSSLHTIDGKAVHVVERFDRADDLRVGYVSAMTMLERGDGEGGSYLEIADVIQRQSPSAAADLRELWRRIAFSILISNFDDHLRNHGFLRTSSSGWSLSPAFDLNPDPRPGERRLDTAIDFDDTAARLDLLLEVAPEFRLSGAEAVEVIGQAFEATSRWREVASALGLPDSELTLMAPAFEHEQFEAARSLAS